MPRKVRELKALLRRAGFTEKAGKGSHTNFYIPGVPGTFVTIAGNDGADAKRYLEQQVEQVIRRAVEAKE
jgi:predicted RNA binding protein YcfA (HicA-like mRNA interferase family)